MQSETEILKTIEKSATVMVVRKSPTVPDRLVEILTDSGHNVLGPVCTAKQALAIAAQHPADVALIEAELAGRRSGLELARELEATWGVRALMLSAE